NARVLPEWQVITIIGDETLRAVEKGRPILLPEVAGVIAVCLIVVQSRQAFAVGVCSLEKEASRELLANGYLQTVVVRVGVKRRSTNTHGLITEIRDTEGDVLGGIRRDPVDRVCGAREPCRVVVVILIHQVNRTRSYETGFQYPLLGKL